MGWTYYNATCYKNGKIDRNAELIKEFESGDNYKVIKSCMVGSTWYAAIKHNDIVFGCVCLTRTNMKDYYNFGYKDMSEDMLPYSFNCPKNIINLLTPTDNKSANEWRKKCLENKKEPNKLNALPVGSIIKWQDSNGNYKCAVKNEPSYQFKTCWYQLIDSESLELRNRYVSKKYIPKNFEVWPYNEFAAAKEQLRQNNIEKIKMQFGIA